MLNEAELITRGGGLFGLLFALVMSKAAAAAVPDDSRCRYDKKAKPVSSRRQPRVRWMKKLFVCSPCSDESIVSMNDYSLVEGGYWGDERWYDTCSCVGDFSSESHTGYTHACVNGSRDDDGRKTFLCAGSWMKGSLASFDGARTLVSRDFWILRYYFFSAAVNVGVMEMVLLKITAGSYVK